MPDYKIDKEDEWLISQYKWRKHKLGYYVTVANKKSPYGIPGMTLYMHRLIMRAGKGDVVDHVNRDRTDNRRCNLRIATHQINAQNRGMQSNNTSGITGVHWCSSKKKWCVQIQGRNHGRFDCLIDAIAHRMSLEYNIKKSA